MLFRSFLSVQPDFCHPLVCLSVVVFDGSRYITERTFSFAWPADFGCPFVVVVAPSCVGLKALLCPKLVDHPAQIIAISGWFCYNFFILQRICSVPNF